MTRAIAIASAIERVIVIESAIGTVRGNASVSENVREDVESAGVMTSTTGVVGTTTIPADVSTVGLDGMTTVTVAGPPTQDHPHPATAATVTRHIARVVGISTVDTTMVSTARRLVIGPRLAMRRSAR